MVVTINRILDTAQEAIRQYCYEQWEQGLGATHQMVLAAVTYLRFISLYFLISAITYPNLATEASCIITPVVPYLAKWQFHSSHNQNQANCTRTTPFSYRRRDPEMVQWISRCAEKVSHS
jgi:hypothetical protein